MHYGGTVIVFRNYVTFHRHVEPLAINGVVRNIFDKTRRVFTDEWTRDTAKEWGLLADFVYRNYAAGHQDPGVFESLTDRERLLKVRDEYDKDEVFKNLWRGGFKL